MQKRTLAATIELHLPHFFIPEGIEFNSIENTSESVGIGGIGGTFEKCALLAKKALTRSLDSESPIKWVADLEHEMLDKVNGLGLGPGGLGGKVTALGLNIETYPTHIAGLPVAVNICCHVNRHISQKL